MYWNSRKVYYHTYKFFCYYTIHHEEGARFWKKSNWNVIVNLKNPNDKRIKGENYKWVSLKQLKKLALRNRCVNPFVKTILFML